MFVALEVAFWLMFILCTQSGACGLAFGWHVVAFGFRYVFFGV
jgi:hypothetical protein